MTPRDRSVRLQIRVLDGLPDALPGLSRGITGRKLKHNGDCAWITQFLVCAMTSLATLAVQPSRSARQPPIFCAACLDTRLCMFCGGYGIRAQPLGHQACPYCLGTGTCPVCTVYLRRRPYWDYEGR